MKRISHKWRFERFSHTRQVRLETGADLAALAELDRKDWVVLSAATAGSDFDARTFAFLDRDGDGRVRVPDVLAALDFLRENHVSMEDLPVANPADAERLTVVRAQQKDLAALPPTPEETAACEAWEKAPDSNAALLPLKTREATAAGAAALVAVEALLDAHFAFSDEEGLVAEGPVRLWPLTGNFNPKHANALTAFANQTARPFFGAEKQSFNWTEWQTLKNAFAPYRDWQAAKPVVHAEAQTKLELEEKVLCLKMNLFRFLHNFVNLADLYSGRRAIFQTGTLFIAGRSCALCFAVADEAAHAALVAKSNCCVLYLKLTRKESAATRLICAVVTAGPLAPLFVGRNGLFYDAEGAVWDAVVTRVVPAEISLREAFWAPWRKLAELVADQMKKFVGERQEKALGTLTKKVEKPTAESPAALASSVAALGVGVGMMGAAFAGLVGCFAGLPWWKTALAVLAVLLAVSLPSVILTYFKLRRRDLGIILNACGWAVNRPLRFSVKLAKRFTSLS